jgi:hypothetical protein
VTELRGCLHAGRNSIARRLVKSESREIPCCGRRKEIQSAETNGFRVEDHPLDEHAPEPSTAPFGIDGGGAEQSIIAALLETGDANELAVALGHDE